MFSSYIKDDDDTTTNYYQLLSYRQRIDKQHFCLNTPLKETRIQCEKQCDTIKRCFRNTEKQSQSQSISSFGLNFHHGTHTIYNPFAIVYIGAN